MPRGEGAAAAAVIGSDAEALAVAHAIAAGLAPGAAARDRERRVPASELDAIAATGLFAISVPRSHGGAGASVATVTEAFRILSAADPAIGQLPQNHFLFVEAIRLDGTPAQRDFFFAEVLRGARFGNAQAERGSSSALDLRTRLTMCDDGYRLNGTKYYCTGALTADWIPVAALDPAERQVLAFVRRLAAGVEVLADWDMIGQRVTFSGTARFTDVAVPAECVVDHWHIFERPTLFHPLGVLLHAAIDVGIARNALEDAAVAIRMRSRARLGAKAASAMEDELLLARFGELTVELHALEALLGAAALMQDEAPARGLSQTDVAKASVAAFATKAAAEDVALAAASDLFALTGSSSAEARHGYDRHWRNARVHTVHDANQWRTQAIGDWMVNHTPPGQPVRRAARA